MKLIKLDVFGRSVGLARLEDTWVAFYLGNEGKKRLATDILVPSSIPEAQLEQYLADLCHERASERHPDVRRLD